MPVMRYVRGVDAPRRIFVAIPNYSGSVVAECLQSLMAAQPMLQAADISIDLCIESGNCHVDDSRNSMVEQFLKTDCTDLVFIDDDVGFDPVDLLRLVNFDRDLVAGVYPKKEDDEVYPVMLEPAREIWAEQDGLVEVKGAPTGFMRIRRHVIDKMIDAFKARSFVSQNGRTYIPLFERLVIDGTRYSGDYAFCQRWIAQGGKIYVDPEMSFTHTGPKTWSGTLGDFWRKRAGLMHPKFDAAMKRLVSGDDSAEVFHDLVEFYGNPFTVPGEFLASAYHLAKRYEHVLETGSGLTTLVMATVADVVSLEHDILYGNQTKSLLAEYGLQDKALVHNCPLKHYADGNIWYDIDKDLIVNYPLVVCDGPPRKYGRSGLFASGPIDLTESVILMDDTYDPQQSQLIESFDKDAREIISYGKERRFTISTPTSMSVAANA